MTEQYINNFKQEIEFSLIQSRDLEKTLLEHLMQFNDDLYDISIFDYDDRSFKLTLNTVVEVGNNFVIQKLLEFIENNQKFLGEDKEIDQSLYLSIYIWIKESTDTPQIDLDDKVLSLMGDIGVHLSFIVYTYDPR